MRAKWWARPPIGQWGDSSGARELQVLELVAQGKANTEVAGEIFVTEATVKSHLAHIFTKLGVSSRTVAVASARSQGLLR